tara:strand:- start:25777 stop:26784 length:1008 start_codon:yes stop_codon:yes gene_type:complete
MKKILYIGNRLHKKGKTVTGVESLGNLLEQEGYVIDRASDKTNKVLRLLDMCFSVIKRRKSIDYILIDTYSTTNFYYAVAVSWLAKRYHIPYLPILHGGNLPYRLKRSKKLSRIVFKNARINVAPSEYLKSVFENNGYINTVCISNAIEIKEYPFSERTLKPNLLWVRSFSEIYNPLLALKSLKILLTEYPEAKLCMVGPDKDGSLGVCEKYALENTLPVQFTGKLTKEEWIALSKEFSVFINTTNFDNTPISVIEAMALGLPVVSTDVGGIPFLLEDNQDAVLVPPRNPSAFANGIKKLLTNEKLSEKLKINARKKAERYDWQKVKEQWHLLLK